MRKGRIILAAVLSVLVFTGCGQEKVPEVSSISILKEGGIKHQIVGSFEQNYYETQGLENLAADRVEEYGNENGADGVVLDSMEEKDGKVIINFSYRSGEDYMEFNHRELFAGTVEQAQTEGYALDKVAFVSANGEPVEADAIAGLEKMSVVIIATKPAEELIVNVYNKVQYVSKDSVSGVDVTLTDKRSVHITNPEKEGAENAVLSYIIF